MWKCKQCDNNIIVKATYEEIDPIVNEITLKKKNKIVYACLACRNKSSNLKNIASWRNQYGEEEGEE